MKPIITIVLTLVVVLGAAYLLFTKGNTSLQDKIANQPGDFSRVPSDDELRAGMINAGLDVLSAEGQVKHIHQHLDITVNGQSIIIPANIGVGGSFISPLHTHDTAGILHIESPVDKDFTLGQFFTQWGIKFDDNCIASFCSDSSNKLVVGVNGQPIANPAGHILQSHDQIHVWYGPVSDNPVLIPSYAFPQGL